MFDAQVLDSERLGGVKELMQHSLVLGLEPATLGRRETLVGKLKPGDGLQGLPDAAELLLEASAQRPER